MNELLATRIVDARDQHMLLALVMMTVLCSLALIPVLLILLTASISAPDGSTDLTRVMPAIYIAIGVAALCVLIHSRARRQRRHAIAGVAALLERGTRANARVVQAQRKSMTQLRLAVHVDGPVAPFSAMIESRLDEAAFVNRPVVVAYDPGNPGHFVLVPDW